MIFEQKLYHAVQKILPKTTTRSFSFDCGMSENYFSSIISQNLRISTSALVHLAEILEHSVTLNQIKNPIEPVLKLIATEIAERKYETKSTSQVVQCIIAKAIAKIAIEKNDLYDAPPIIMGWR